MSRALIFILFMVSIASVAGANPPSAAKHVAHTRVRTETRPMYDLELHKPAKIEEEPAGSGKREQGAPHCELSQITIPAEYHSLVAEKAKVVRYNQRLTARFEQEKTEYAVRQAIFQACTAKKASPCQDPGQPPRPPAFQMSYLYMLGQPEYETERVRLYTRVGNWLFCAMIYRRVAQEACFAGDRSQMQSLDQNIKRFCQF